MKAVLCKSLDGPEHLVVDDVPEPEPGAGEVLIKVTAVALNHFDTLITRGKYQTKPDCPFSPGGEIAGVIEQVAAGVQGLAPGQRVMAYLGYGGAREKIVVSAGHVTRIPHGVTDAAAASVPIAYGTALHGLKDRGRLQPGEMVAVLGAAGGAGLAAVEIAKLMGGKVIAVASSDKKLAVCKTHGADVLINYAEGDLKQALREASGGNGVDVIYDCVGGEASEPALRALAWQGRFLVVGFASGAIPKMPLNLLLVKGVDMAGVFWGEAAKRDPEAHRRNMDQLLTWVAEGKLRPHIGHTFPFAEAAQAIGVLDRREAQGKVILVP